MVGFVAFPSEYVWLWPYLANLRCVRWFADQPAPGNIWPTAHRTLGQGTDASCRAAEEGQHSTTRGEASRTRKGVPLRCGREWRLRKKGRLCPASPDGDAARRSPRRVLPGRGCARRGASSGPCVSPGGRPGGCFTPEGMPLPGRSGICPAPPLFWPVSIWRAVLCTWRGREAFFTLAPFPKIHRHGLRVFFSLAWNALARCHSACFISHFHRGGLARQEWGQLPIEPGRLLDDSGASPFLH